MNENLEMYFTTGEFAQLCGVKKQTLFHYDNIGLFCPICIKENGYRCYSYHQLYTFHIICALKELNMPLKEIKTYLDSRTPEKYINLIKYKIADIDREIEKLNKIRKLMLAAASITENVLNIDCNKIILKELEEEFLIISSNIDPNSNMDFSKIMVQYIEFCKSQEISVNDYIGTMITTNKIINGKYTSYSNIYIKTTNKNIDSVIVRPKGIYLIAYHKGSYETIYKTYEKVVAYTKDNNLELGEYLYEEYLLENIAVKDEDEYITEIMVEIKNINMDKSVKQ